MSKENFMKVRAKFTVQSKKTAHPYYEGGDERYELTMRPVTGNSAENDQFYGTTPSGELTMTVINKNVFDYFEQNKSYYIDFTKVE